MTGRLVFALCAGIAVACPHPFAPTSAPDIYTGTWQGLIGDSMVTIRLEASRQSLGFGLTGNATLADTSLQDGGSLWVSGVGGVRTVVLNFRDDLEFQGQVNGTVEGRTLRGDFTGPRSSPVEHDYDGVFGVEKAAVVFVRQ